MRFDLDISGYHGKIMIALLLLFETGTFAASNPRPFAGFVITVPPIPTLPELSDLLCGPTEIASNNHINGTHAQITKKRYESGQEFSSLNKELPWPFSENDKFFSPEKLPGSIGTKFSYMIKKGINFYKGKGTMTCDEKKYYAESLLLDYTSICETYNDLFQVCQERKLKKSIVPVSYVTDQLSKLVGMINDNDLKISLKVTEPLTWYTTVNVDCQATQGGLKLYVAFVPADISVAKPNSKNAKLENPVVPGAAFTFVVNESVYALVFFFTGAGTSILCYLLCKYVPCGKILSSLRCKLAKKSKAVSKKRSSRK